MRYFLLSHNHHQDGERLLDELFVDIGRRVRAATGADRGAEVGAQARTHRLTGPSGAAINRAVAECKVLVPLYSPRYFTSSECGKVVSAFVDRGPGHPAPGRSPIAPLLWIRPTRSWPPVPVPPREIAGADRYHAHGLYELMLARGGDDADHCYDAVLDGLARQIVELAADTVLPAGAPIDVAAHTNAFARAAHDPRVAIGVLAPVTGRLPAGCEPGHYGTTATDWNPYPHDTDQPLGTHLAALARRLGFAPTVTALDPDGADLPGETAPTSPAILLIDPWALDNPTCRQRLRAFDQSHRAWVSVMGAWNPREPRTAGARQRLLEQYEATLQNRHARRRPALQIDARVASTLVELGRSLPTVLQETTRRYLTWMSARRHP